MARNGRGKGFEITPAVLLKAYACGIFPMAESSTDPRLFWVDPNERGILPLDAFHCPRSLKKVIKRETFTVTVDTAFAAVVDGCAEPAPGRIETWINPTIRNLYLALFDEGYAHSVETWRDGFLVGGLYGVSLGGAFFGESMFFQETNASKIALIGLDWRLRQMNFRLIDCQFPTKHLLSLGAENIPRHQFLTELNNSRTYNSQQVRWHLHIPSAMLP